MFKIGCHLSISSGFYKAAELIESIGGNVFQYFSRNPQGGAIKEFDYDDFRRFQMKFSDMTLLTHAPYTLNPASAKAEVREFARMVFKEDIRRLENFNSALYNFHPGSHTGIGIEKGIEYIVEILNESITKDQKTTILLETMSGKGSEIGVTFEEIRKIIDNVTYSDKIGVCLDTCHVYSAGYDIANDLDNVLIEFDRVIGLDRLKAIHLNDSKMPFDSKKDRHEKIGYGTIGFDAFSRIINHPKLRDFPFFLETPNEIFGYEEEITLLKKMRNC